jgi:stage V sporulation protein AB
MGEALAGFTGLCAGLVSGAALCALYIALGVFTWPAMRLGLRPGRIAGTAAAAGAAAGTAVTLFDVRLPIGGFFAGAAGLLAGVYTGILIACLAEVADSIPLVRRFGVPVRLIAGILLAFAAGKLVGSLIYWLIL